MKLSIKVRNLLFTLWLFICGISIVALLIEHITAKIAYEVPDSTFCLYCFMAIVFSTVIIPPFTAIKK